MPLCDPIKYLYLSIQLHTRLQYPCINSDRILDLHYSDRHIVALLIHNGNETERCLQLKQVEITIHEFDLYDAQLPG